jgi:hypothetical protein
MTGATANSVAASQDALYVYCVAGGEGNCILGSIGLEGESVYTVGCGSLRAVVHNCKGRPYQSIEPEVVQRWVVAHQEVVRAASKSFGTVLPMSFDMIVRGADGSGSVGATKAWLDEKRERFTRLLDKLSGKAEYGVQVLWDRQAIAATLVETDGELGAMRDEARGKPKGLAHLLEQKLAKAMRAAMENHADSLAQKFYVAIRRCVADVHIDKLKKLDGDMQMLLNLSCLMPEGSGELGRVLDDLQKSRGISVRFTGPWPPYSFVGG